MQSVQIAREIIERSLNTTAMKIEDGGLAISFIVPNETGQLVKRTFLVGEQGKQNIVEEASGGIVTDLSMADIAAANGGAG